MNVYRWSLAMILGLLLAGGAARWSAAQGPALTAPPGSSTIEPSATEVLTRGPVHEAFAEPVTAPRESGVVIPKRPPEPIEELPPSNKPEAGDAAWISGYWAWDEERSDFLWVSGVWRVPPENHSWVPGYWAETQGGYQWVSGFWLPAQTQEVSYLDEPPASVEAGPSSPAPSTDHFWVPGCWTWAETRYAWRPGFWSPAQADWVWVPAHYCWTPRGWVFIDGYWDYPLVRRGLLFAPVYFRRPFDPRPHFVFSPTVVIDPFALTTHLFVRPNYCHYYFGDWYAPAYASHGFQPWFVEARIGYDPLFVYYRWYHEHHRHERDWSDNLRGWHQYYQRHEDMRPPHTLAAQHEITRHAGNRSDLSLLNIGAPLHDYAQRRDAPIRLTTLSQPQREQFREGANRLGEFTQQRVQLESQRSRGPEGKPGPDSRAKIEGKPGSKIEGKPGSRNEQVRGPDRVRLPNLPNLGTVSGSQAGPGAGQGRATVGPQAGPTVNQGPTGGPRTRTDFDRSKTVQPQVGRQDREQTPTLPGGAQRFRRDDDPARRVTTPSVTAPSVTTPSPATTVQPGRLPGVSTPEAGRQPSVTLPKSAERVTSPAGPRSSTTVPADQTPRRATTPVVPQQSGPTIQRGNPPAGESRRAPGGPSAKSSGDAGRTGGPAIRTAPDAGRSTGPATRSSSDAGRSSGPAARSAPDAGRSGGASKSGSGGAGDTTRKKRDDDRDRNR